MSQKIGTQTIGAPSHSWLAECNVPPFTWGILGGLSQPKYFMRIQPSKLNGDFTAVTSFENGDIVVKSSLMSMNKPLNGDIEHLNLAFRG